MEAKLRLNLRVSAVRVELTDLDMHTLSRETQEVMVGLIVASLVSPLITTLPLSFFLLNEE